MDLDALVANLGALVEARPWLIPVVISAVVAALTTSVTTWFSRRQVRAAQRNVVDVLFSISDRWTEVLKVRYRVRNRANDYINVRTKYANVRDFMASEEWADLRAICSLYELVGMITHANVIQLKTVLVLVSVDDDDRKILQPTIEWLRTDYRADIYRFADWYMTQSARVKARSTNAERAAHTL